MAKVTEMDVKAQMLRDMRTHQVKWIASHSIVHLDDGRVGYLEKNTGGKPWVIVDPGQLGVEVSKHERLEVLVTPCELARDWMAQLDVCGPSTYRDATSELLAVAELALTTCNIGSEQPALEKAGLWHPNIFCITATLLKAAIKKFERTRK